MNRIRVAIAGAGAMAREHARAFASLPDAELCGITSRTRAKAEALAGELAIGEVFDSVGSMSAATNPDLIVVAVPPLVMREVAEQCFLSGAVVMLEKPPGYDLADAEAIAASAREQKRRVHVALNRRSYSSTRAAAERLDTLPGARFITVHDQQDLDVALRIGHPPKIVENWMFGNSIHLVDYLRVFGRGRITTVEPVSRWNPADPGPVVAAVRFASGDAGLYVGIWNAPGPWAVTVTTADERWELRPLERAVFQRRGERELHQVEVDVADVEYKAGFRHQAALAIRAAKGEQTELPTLDEAIETMRLISEIYSL